MFESTEANICQKSTMKTLQKSPQSDVAVLLIDTNVYYFYC